MHSRTSSTTPADPRTSHKAPQTLDSAQLLQGRRELLIRHGHEVYRLCHTRNDKLILTK